MVDGEMKEMNQQWFKPLAAPVLTLRGEETMESFNPVSWYEPNNGSYPIRVTAIAYNIYAVPAMSAEAERVLSRYIPSLSSLILTAKQTITERRNRLNTDTVKIIECFEFMAEGRNYLE